MNSGPVITAVGVKATTDTPLGLTIEAPSVKNNGLVGVKGLTDDSIFAGSGLQPGMSVLGVNGVNLYGRSLDDVTKLLQSIQGPVILQALPPAPPPLTVRQPNAAATATQQTPSAATAKKPAPVTVAAKPAPPLPPVSALMEMQVKELKAELRKRSLSQGGLKDDLLERLGVPSRQWKAWREMKVVELKQECRQRGKTVTGTKPELLERLGVPKGFGESKHQTMMREHKERMKDRKQQAEQQKEQLLADFASQVASQFVNEYKKQKTSHSTDDPTSEHYTVDCCTAPRFATRSEEPCGYIQHMNGGITEVWHCKNCGMIPQHPNAPPIQLFSDDEEDDDPFGSTPDFVFQPFGFGWH